jgi:phosphate transport system protein
MIMRVGLQSALADLYRQLLELEGLVERSLGLAVEALKVRDADMAETVMVGDDAIDALAARIEEEAIRIIALHQPVGSDLRRIIGTIRVTIDLERVADLAGNIAEIVPDLARQPLLKPLIDIPRMMQIAQQMLHDGLNALRDDDTELARQVCLRDDEIDGLYMQIFRELVSFISEDPRTTSRAIPLLFAARHLERVGDHATNIAEIVFYQKTGQRIRLRDIMAESEDGTAR